MTSRGPEKSKSFHVAADAWELKTHGTLQEQIPFLNLSPSWCVLCKKSKETMWHLFFNCPFAVSCWKELFQIFKLTWCFPNSAPDALLQLIQGPYLKEHAKILWTRGVVVLVWRLWFERNNGTF